MLQIQSVNSKRLWEKGVKWHQCFRCLTLPRHGGLFTTRGITEKTIVGSHLGDRFVKVCKTFGAKQILRLYSTIKKKTVYTKHTCRWFLFLFSALLVRLLQIHLQYPQYLQTVLHPLISYYWPLDLHIFLQLAALEQKTKLNGPQRVVNRETDNSSCTPKDVALWEKTSCWQFCHQDRFLWLYYVRCERSFLMAILWETVSSEHEGSIRKGRYDLTWEDSRQSGWVKVVALFAIFWDVLVRLPTWPNSIAVREKHRNFDGIKRTDSIKPLASELSRVTAQPVSRRPHTSEGRVILEALPWGICGEQSDATTSLHQVVRFFRVSIIPPVLHTHISLIYIRR